MFIDTVDRAARASRAGSMESSRAGPVGDCLEGWREALDARLAPSISHRARALGEPPAAEGGAPRRWATAPTGRCRSGRPASGAA